MRTEQEHKNNSNDVFLFRSFFFCSLSRSELEHMGSWAPNPILFGITSCDSHGYEPSVVRVHCGFSFSSYPFLSADISALLPSLLFLVKSARAHWSRLPLCGVQSTFFFSLVASFTARVSHLSLLLFICSAISVVREINFFVAHFGFDIYRPFREWVCWYSRGVHENAFDCLETACVCVYSIEYLMPTLLLLLLGMY